MKEDEVIDLTKSKGPKQVREYVNLFPKTKSNPNEYVVFTPHFNVRKTIPLHRPVGTKRVGRKKVDIKAERYKTARRRLRSMRAGRVARDLNMGYGLALTKFSEEANTE